jgi:hypothetical protein
MISILLMAGTFMLAQYGYGAPPPSNSYQGNSGSGLDTAPFVQLQRKCFDKAVSETEGAAPDVKRQRYDTCFALHDAMVKHATAKLSEKEAAGAKHDIDRALGGVEKSYAKKLGVAMPEEAK